MRVPFPFLFVGLVSPAHQENQNSLAPRLSAPISSVAGAGQSQVWWHFWSWTWIYLGGTLWKNMWKVHTVLSSKDIKAFVFSYIIIISLFVMCDAHWFSPTFSFGWLWLLCRKGSPVHKFIWERQKEQMKVRCGEKGSSSQASQKKRVLACCGKYFQSHVYCLYMIL